jgi:hypothetical protein
MKKPWALTFKYNESSSRFPIGRYRSKTRGNVARICTTFDWSTAVLFDTKEQAKFYIYNYSFKYPEQTKRLRAITVKELLARQKARPCLQLHTGKLLIKNAEKVK